MPLSCCLTLPVRALAALARRPAAWCGTHPRRRAEVGCVRLTLDVQAVDVLIPHPFILLLLGPPAVAVVPARPNNDLNPTCRGPRTGRIFSEDAPVGDGAAGGLPPDNGASHLKSPTHHRHGDTPLPT